MPGIFCGLLVHMYGIIIVFVLIEPCSRLLFLWFIKVELMISCDRMEYFQV